MAYAALSDLVARAGEQEILQVADRDDDSVADADVIAGALEQADATINAYLGTRFQLPLTSTPEIVVKWAVSLARYWLHRDGAPDHVTADYKAAMAELRDAADGRIGLPDAAGLAPAGDGGAIASTGSEPIFDRDGLEGWL